MVKDLERKTHEEQLRCTGFSLDKRRMRGDIVITYSQLMAAYSQGMISALCQTGW